VTYTKTPQARRGHTHRSAPGQSRAKKRHIVGKREAPARHSAGAGARTSPACAPGRSRGSLGPHDRGPFRWDDGGGTEGRGQPRGADVRRGSRAKRGSLRRGWPRTACDLTEPPCDVRNVSGSHGRDAGAEVAHGGWCSPALAPHAWARRSSTNAIAPRRRRCTPSCATTSRPWRVTLRDLGEGRKPKADPMAKRTPGIPGPSACHEPFGT